MFNTPPCFVIFTIRETLKWLKKLGGVNKMYEMNKEKAKLLYDEIDRNPIFVGTVEKESRSLMNICFIMNEQYKPLRRRLPEIYPVKRNDRLERTSFCRCFQGFNL